MLQDVIRTICSPYGFVQRTVIFRKNGLQVLVEYPAQMSIQIVFVCVGGHVLEVGCFLLLFLTLCAQDLIQIHQHRGLSSSWMELTFMLVVAP